MQVRNFLRAGDFAVLVPLGIPTTLQYGQHGNFEKVYIGYDSSSWEASSEIASQLIKLNKIPMHVSSYSGTIFVRGVIYTEDIPPVSGKLPNAIIDILVKKVVKSGKFNFFAGHISAKGAKFTGGSQIQAWLKSHQFNTLSGYVVPATNVENTFKRLMESSAFEYNKLMAEFKISPQGLEINMLDRRECKVNDYLVYLDEYGYIHSQLSLDNGDLLNISYYDFKYWNIEISDYLVLDSSNTIIRKHDNYTSKLNVFSYTCPICGCKYNVYDEFSRCSNIDCLSKQYHDIIHFLKTLNLAEIEYSEYIDYVNSGKLTKFSDILSLPQYENYEINTSIYEILDAIIPISEVRNRSAIWELYSKSNGSLDSISYYLDHPRSINSDLGIDCPDLVRWLEHDQHVSTIFEIIQYTNVVLQSNVKKFEGSPIFRDKKLYLTGQFKHGSYAEVEAILASYGASIASWDDADACLVGDIPENVDGIAIHKFNDLNLPVFSETEFFDIYELDPSDM